MVVVMNTEHAPEPSGADRQRQGQSPQDSGPSGLTNGSPVMRSGFLLDRMFVRPLALDGQEMAPGRRFHTASGGMLASDPLLAPSPVLGRQSLSFSTLATGLIRDFFRPAEIHGRDWSLQVPAGGAERKDLPEHRSRQVAWEIPLSENVKLLVQLLRVGTTNKDRVAEVISDFSPDGKQQSNGDAKVKLSGGRIGQVFWDRTVANKAQENQEPQCIDTLFLSQEHPVNPVTYILTLNFPAGSAHTKQATQLLYLLGQRLTIHQNDNQAWNGLAPSPPSPGY
jgi:hypothetical protein